jgi:hypothetical protein
MDANQSLLDEQKPLPYVQYGFLYMEEMHGWMGLGFTHCSHHDHTHTRNSHMFG